MLKDKAIRFLATAGLLFAALIGLSGEIGAERFSLVALEQKELLQVKVHGPVVGPTSKQPVVLLADSLEEYALPIWIGLFEANAIYSEIRGIKHRRPLTHDLLERIIQKANGKIHRIVITHQKEGIYYATIVMEKGGSLVEIDARPSDSIVMALKFKAPIFVSKSLFTEMAIPLGEHKEIEERYGLSLQELNPSLAQYFSFGSTHGVLVSEVRKGSRAEKDGIERGDIFVEVGGQSVEDVMKLKDALAKGKTAVQARIFRKAHFLSITLHPN
jgi:bifunctional DNase/RNase